MNKTSWETYESVEKSWISLRDNKEDINKPKT